MGLIQGPKGRELGNWHLIAQKPKEPALRRWKERDQEQEVEKQRYREDFTGQKGSSWESHCHEPSTAMS